MNDKQVELYTAGKIAEALKVSPGKIKKAIAELDIKPISKKGVCNYYSIEQLKKIEKQFVQ